MSSFPSCPGWWLIPSQKVRTGHLTGFSGHIGRLKELAALIDIKVKFQSQFFSHDLRASEVLS